jgi:hypothetical protein
MHEHSIWPIVEKFAAQSTQLFIKKLSRNDVSWANDSSKHQAGFYIPKEVRESGFFPTLIADNPEKPHIYHSSCVSFWPQTGEVKQSGLRHFSNKGPETHFTTVPREAFSDLNPASWLVSGKFSNPYHEASHWFVVADSGSDDAEILETNLDLQADFHFGLFDPDRLAIHAALIAEQADQLIEQLNQAIRSGTLEDFVRSASFIPSSDEIAKQARQQFLLMSGESTLDPYQLQNPGDVIMRISRDIEFRIFKQHELRRRASEVVAIIARDQNLPAAVVRGFPLLDSVFLSASQQRKTRAGRSFENHLGFVLSAGRILYEEQAILGGRRPDFVLPSKSTLALRDKRPYIEALILSAKTTLRERWKQITHERFNCAIFLATVDDRISKQALDEMQQLDICLVVPESLKLSQETFYSGHENVISFRDFFDSEIRRDRPYLIC